MESGVILLKEILDSCTGAERKAAEFILANPKSVMFYTITELGKQSQTNAPTIVRLCKRAGLSGYRELQMLIAKDVYTDTAERDPELPDFQLESDVPIDRLAKDAADKLQDGMSRLLAMLDVPAIEECAARIKEARTVAVFGVGASAVVGLDFCQKLLRLGIPCLFSLDADAQITAGCGLRPGDVAFAISYSGENASVLQAVGEAKASGAAVFALTRMGSNSLSRLADRVMCIPASESTFRLGATTSRLTQLAVIDILYGTLISRDLERTLPLIERTMRATHQPDHKE